MKKITVNERVAPAGGCGCDHAAVDHTHEHDGSVGGACCGDTDRAHPKDKQAKGCCGEPRVPETSRNPGGLSDADKDKGHQR